ncbi:hypothetical protein B0H13DRAFT_2683364 [Mycena leptocephala]|nr:hypothetical protein B0H13DRAFT_2683364 [Mycena leptocephala]
MHVPRPPTAPQPPRTSRKRAGPAPPRASIVLFGVEVPRPRTPSAFFPPLLGIPAPALPCLPSYGWMLRTYLVQPTQSPACTPYPPCGSFLPDALEYAYRGHPPRIPPAPIHLDARTPILPDRAGTDRDPSPSARIWMGTRRRERKPSPPLRGVHDSRMRRELRIVQALLRPLYPHLHAQSTRHGYIRKSTHPAHRPLRPCSASPEITLAHATGRMRVSAVSTSGARKRVRREALPIVPRTKERRSSVHVLLPRASATRDMKEWRTTPPCSQISVRSKRRLQETGNPYLAACIPHSAPIHLSRTCLHPTSTLAHTRPMIRVIVCFL